MAAAQRLKVPESSMSALNLPGEVLPFAPLQETQVAAGRGSTLPVSVVIAARNEARNLPACLDSVASFGEVVVVDSQSTDTTVEIARAFGANVVQFHYDGGWPKKRQWALDHLPLRYEWVLLLDADEAVTPELFAEIRDAMDDPKFDGFYISLELVFLGRRLRHCGASFYKLCLFRRGLGRFECRATDQDSSMCDMEVHEHMVVRGAARQLRHKLLHRNIDSLSRYIQKHNEYSNWEARVWTQEHEHPDALPPKLTGTQAQRRRWLKQKFLRWPGSPLMFFLYRYILRAGFLDGVPGFIYCAFQGIQFFHIKAKLYEHRLSQRERAFASAAQGSHVRY